MTQKLEQRLTIRRSTWRKYVGEPKTPGSMRPVPVVEPLRVILAELRAADGNPERGPILRGTRGQPLDLELLARRDIIPTLKSKGITWPSYYALRRGIATMTTSETNGDAQAAAGLLRHDSMAVTMENYIKTTVPENTRRAMQVIEQRALTRMAERELNVKQICSNESSAATNTAVN